MAINEIVFYYQYKVWKNVASEIQFFDGIVALTLIFCCPENKHILLLTRYC